MDDKQIVDLYLARDESAIAETAQKYAALCGKIASHILYDREDCKECVNDAYLRAWNSIPPKRPDCFSAFLLKITRNLALNRLKQASAAKRGGGETPAALSELEESLPTPATVEDCVDANVLTGLLNAFLSELPKEQRVVFVRRYWFLDPISEIAAQFHMSESKVKSQLFRIRQKLKAYLQKEDIAL